MSETDDQPPDARNAMSGAYAAICWVFIALGLCIYCFTWWGNPMHGPGGGFIMAREVAIVLAAYSALELIRSGNLVLVAGLPSILILVAEVFQQFSLYLRY